MNKYCGEYITIGNEVWPETASNDKSDDDDDDSGERLSEPVAEARIHQEQNFHQFTNLKIIKAEKNESQQATPPRAKNISELKMLKILEKEKPRNKIYSQVICKSDFHFSLKESFSFSHNSQRITKH